MPRANRRRDEGPPLDLGRATAGAPRREGYAGADWFVRSLAGTGVGGPYRCPGCQQELPRGRAHVVVWPADGSGGLAAVEQRRHWHTVCWANRHTRPPLGSWR